MNPFQDVPLYEIGESKPLAESANAWFQKNRLRINSIVENAFFNNSAFDGNDICVCKYILCCTPALQDYSGLLGLGIRREGDKFVGLDLYDIGAESPNLVSKMEFMTCAFISLDDQTTFVFVSRQENGSYRYFFLNESSFDPKYGFPEIAKVVVDGLTIEVGKVFDKVE